MEKITAQVFAANLTGREYGRVPNVADCKIAKENGLVIIFGASDDLFEIAGALENERDAYEGGTFYLNRSGLVEFPPDIDCETAALKITAVWRDEGNPCWTYKLESPVGEFPHETFRIMEDGEVYCEGVVLRLEDLPEGTPTGTVSVDGVEYAPVRRALWRLYEGEYECTACGEKYYKEDLDAIGPCNDSPPLYCPRCGTRMDAEHH